MTAHARAIKSEDAACIEADLENVRITIRRGLSGSASSTEVEAVECVLLLRSYMWQRGLWSDWSHDVEAAIISSDRNGLKHYAARLRAYLAGLYEARGRWREVVELSTKVLESTSDPEALGDALFHRGTALHNLGRSRKALKAYAGALRLSPDSTRRAAINHKVSRVLKALGKRGAAESCLDQTVEVARNSGDRWFYAELLLDKVGYVRSTQLGAALKLAEESLAIYSDLAFARGVAYAELQCGRLLALLGDDCRSNECFETALRRFRRESYLPGQAHGHFLRGLARLAQGSVQASREDFWEACATARESEYRRMAIAGAAGALIAALKGRVQIGATLLLVLRTQDWWKALGLALQLQIRGAESVLRKGMRV